MNNRIPTERREQIKAAYLALPRGPTGKVAPEELSNLSKLFGVCKGSIIRIGKHNDKRLRSKDA